MPTYTQIFYHIVFSTKNRKPVLLEAGRERLFRYIWGVVKEKNGCLYRINGVEDHLHILTSLHPSVALADFVKDVKVSTGKMIAKSGIFPDFVAWQEGYGAFTHALKDKEVLVAYISNQQKHHQKELFLDEYRNILQKQGVTFDEKYLL